MRRSLKSSMSPCRQLCPSTFAIEAILPAPKAVAGVERASKAITRQTSNKGLVSAMDECFLKNLGDAAVIFKEYVFVVVVRLTNGLLHC